MLIYSYLVRAPTKVNMIYMWSRYSCLKQSDTCWVEGRCRRCGRRRHKCNVDMTQCTLHRTCYAESLLMLDGWVLSTNVYKGNNCFVAYTSIFIASSMAPYLG